LEETKNWLRRSHKRKLIKEENFTELDKRIELLGKKLNAFINSIKKQYAKKPVTNNQ